MQHQFILHIGQPKTGTTVIQDFLISHKQELENYGWVCKTPDDVKFVWDKRNAMFRSLRRSQQINDEIREQLDEFWADIAQSLQEYNVLFSWENGWGEYGKLVYKYLKSRFHNLKILVYLRRQDLWLESWWNQNVKESFYSNKDMNFQTELNIYKSPQFSFQVNYYDTLSAIGKIVGNENLIVRTYDKERFKKVNLINDFLEAVGLPMQAGDFGKTFKANPQLTLEQLEIKRIINECVNRAQNCSWRSVRDWMLETYRLISQNNKESKQKISLFTEEERKNYLAQYEKGNQRVADEFCHFNGAPLFNLNIDYGRTVMKLPTLIQEISETFQVYTSAFESRFEVLKDDIANWNCKYEKRKSTIIEEYHHGYDVFQQVIAQHKTIISRFLSLDAEELQTDSCLKIVEDYMNDFIMLHNMVCGIERHFIETLVDNRKILAMPGGVLTKELMHNSDVVISGILDNNPDLSGTSICGVPVKSPVEVDDLSQYFIFITSGIDRITEAIETRLESFGLHKYSNYISKQRFWMYYISTTHIDENS